MAFFFSISGIVLLLLLSIATPLTNGYGSAFFIVVVFFFALYYKVYKLIQKEYSLWKFFSKDENRGKHAKDPRRFHSSIIYLMAEVLRAGGEKAPISKNKLLFVIRYINEVCDESFRNDAVDLLDNMTRYIHSEGKDSYSYSYMNDYAVKKNKEVSQYVYECDRKIDRYENKLHGEYIADELSHCLNETDKLYLMFVLFRLAIADGKLTTKGKSSDLCVLQKMCVNGLKIKADSLKNLIDCWKIGRLDDWYSNLFANGNYPSPDAFANIFRGESLSFYDDPILANEKTSVQRPLSVYFFVILVAHSIFSFSAFLIVATSAFPEDFYFSFWPIVPALCVWLLYPLLDAPDLESFKFGVLRTKAENVAQRNCIIRHSIAFACEFIAFYYLFIALFYVEGNNIIIGKESDVERTIMNVNQSNNQKGEFSYDIYVNPITKAEIENVSYSADPYIMPLDWVVLRILQYSPGTTIFIKGKPINYHYFTLSSYDALDFDYEKTFKIKFKQGYFGYWTTERPDVYSVPLVNQGQTE